jgi:hypothetical protein
MKEVLTKNFWLGVKKTFYDALEDRPAEADAGSTPEDDPKGTSKPDIPPSPSAVSEPIPKS